MQSWQGYVAITVACWGLYGICLHAGAVGMGDPEYGRVKAFLFVGVAYFLVAVLAPIGLLGIQGASWEFSTSAVGWSILAGTVGAVGAFGVLLAFGAGGTPPVVMTLIFAGAPIVNALVGVTMAGQWGQIRWQFVLGILLAVAGAALVGRYKPPPVKHGPPATAEATAPER